MCVHTSSSCSSLRGGEDERSTCNVKHTNTCQDIPAIFCLPATHIPAPETLNSKHTALEPSEEHVLSADHLVLVVLAGKDLQRGLNDASTQPHDKVQGGICNERRPQSNPT